MSAELKRRLITVDEYHRMAEAGILGPHERVELLRGEIVTVAPMGDRHRGAINRLTRLFSASFSDVAYVQVQCPIIVSGDSEPEPDLALLRMNEAAIGERHVDPQDVFAAIEVADSSRRSDYGVKVPLYAETGIPETWIVDLVAREIVMYRDLLAGAYGQRRVARAGDAISFRVFPGISLDAALILGRTAAND